MNLLSTIRFVFTVLAVAGLVLAPLARPAMAMPSQTQGTMSEHAAATDAAMAMQANTPCCPDKAPASDCGKECPLMALCMVSGLLFAPLGVALSVPFKLAAIVYPANDADLGSLAQAPPPRPPRA